MFSDESEKITFRLGIEIERRLNRKEVIMQQISVSVQMVNENNKTQSKLNSKLQELRNKLKLIKKTVLEVCFFRSLKEGVRNMTVFKETN